LKDVLKTALFSIFGVTLKRAKMKALTRANSRETSSGVRKRHFLATDEISVRLKKFQMVFGSFATFFILLGGLVILTYKQYRWEEQKARTTEAAHKQARARANATTGLKCTKGRRHKEENNG
jgi:hypothetical protein